MGWFLAKKKKQPNQREQNDVERSIKERWAKYVEYARRGFVKTELDLLGKAAWGIYINGSWEYYECVENGKKKHISYALK